MVDRIVVTFPQDRGHPGRLWPSANAQLRIFMRNHNMLDPRPQWKTPSGSIHAPPRGRLRKILHPNVREKTFA
jgi:hypothetical protein